MLMYVRFVVIFHWTADKKELNELGDKKTVIENTDYSLPPTPPPLTSLYSEVSSESQW